MYIIFVSGNTSPRYDRYERYDRAKESRDSMFPGRTSIIKSREIIIIANGWRTVRTWLALNRTPFEHS